MLWRLLLAAFILAVAVGLAVEHAVTKTEIHTISGITGPDTVGGILAIEGTITDAKNNRFRIEDSTGSARLITCPMWYKRINLYPGDKVTVIGQVMSAPSEDDPDVVMTVYKFLRDGEEIVVRERPGKPPWLTAAY